MATVRDSLWLWGTRVNALQQYGFPTSRMTISTGLEIFGLDQAMMCGMLPPREEEYAQVKGCRNLLWEMSFGEGFSFDGPLEPIVGLHENHPNVKAVLLDDFSTTEISKGASPQVLERLRAAMPASMDLWIVIYSMSLDIPNLREYLRHADGVSFWVWNACEVPRMRAAVHKCNELSGGKPLILGLYLYDFGNGKEISPNLMELQAETGIRLLREGAARGLCFLSSSIMDVGLASVDWTRQWILEHGDNEV